MNNIYDKKDGLYIKEWQTIDLNKRYVDEYKEREITTNYYNPQVFINRYEWISKRIDITKAFDYGCGLKPFYLNIPEPVQPMGMYDKYIEPHTIFNLNDFNNSESIIMSDVLEHFTDPESFLQMLPQKNLIISVPCVPINNFYCIYQIKDWTHYKNEHYIYANKEGWEYILNQSGWGIIDSGEFEAPIRKDILCIHATRD